MRLSPKLHVVRALFARSGNQCAFPDCVHTLVNAKNQFVGEICHIEAASPKGPRYNSHQTDEQRRDYGNLLLLCHAHHVETNDVSEYTTDVLKAIKKEHEDTYKKFYFSIEEGVLRKITASIESYWDRIDRLNRLEHVAPPDVAVSIDARASFSKVVESCRETLQWMSSRHDALRESSEELRGDFRKLLTTNGVDASVFDAVPYYENPFVNRDWETHHVSLPNGIQRLQVDLLHLEIKFLEECLKSNGGSQEVQIRLDQLREQFAEMARSEVAVD